MIKYLSVLIVFLNVHFLTAQQNDEFRSVMDYFGQKRAQMLDSFSNEIKKPYSESDKILIKNDYLDFLDKLDSIQNVAMVGALIKVKNREDLEKIIVTTDNKKSKQSSKSHVQETPAEYPGGINTLRQELAALFYFDAMTTLITPKLSTDIRFIVEKDGSISSVHASGENFVFNRQAEIAMYMLSNKFNPAMMNGERIRYQFQIPLTMNFEKFNN